MISTSPSGLGTTTLCACKKKPGWSVDAASPCRACRRRSARREREVRAHLMHAAGRRAKQRTSACVAVARSTVNVRVRREAIGVIDRDVIAALRERRVASRARPAAVGDREVLLVDLAAGANASRSAAIRLGACARRRARRTCRCRGDGRGRRRADRRRSQRTRATARRARSRSCRARRRAAVATACRPAC